MKYGYFLTYRSKEIMPLNGDVYHSGATDRSAVEMPIYYYLLFTYCLFPFSSLLSILFLGKSFHF